jgi:tetratricopeptide (TPR) repeat protein
MKHPVNPYVAGPPLREVGQFFGRTDTVRWVSQELLNPSTNALVLFGQRRIGKTTLLVQLEQILADGVFLPVYFDLQNHAKRPLSEVLVDLAEDVAERAKLPSPDLKATDNRGRFFRRDFLPWLYQKLEEDCRPVLLLDEFDVLHPQPGQTLDDSVAARALFPFLRGLMAKDPRIAFVFAMGRQAEDLSTDYTSVFKGALVQEVWVLDPESATALILQAQVNETLNFDDEVVERILSLAGRHPYMTQLLCQRIWERAYTGNPTSVPNIQTADVEAAVPDALRAGDSALSWLWGGLNPAEKVYAAALAQAAGDDYETISADRVVEVLGSHASRLRAEPVEMAPQKLVKRRVLEICGEGEYRFAVELFRRWVRRHQPLREVKDELDRMYPLAEEFFSVGERVAQQGDWEKAIAYFKDALEKDPRHFHAQLQLGETLLKLARAEAAVRELERAYELDKEAARLPLARALVAKARNLQGRGEEDAALAACVRALEVFPGERAAQEIKETIWARRGNAAMERGELDLALAAYQQAGAKGWEEAVTFVEEAIENDPSLFRSRFYLGQVLLELGQTEKALTRLDAILAIYQQKSFNFEKTEDFFRKLSAREPRNALAKLYLGELYRAAGRVEEAVEQFNLAHEVSPTEAKPYLVRALLKQAQLVGEAGNWADALAAYLRVLEVDATRLDVLNEMKTSISQLQGGEPKKGYYLPDGREERTYLPSLIDKEQIFTLLEAAERRVRLLGVLALDLNWSQLARAWANKIRKQDDFKVTVLCESDNLLFTKSLILDTDVVKTRRSFRKLKFARDKALDLIKEARLVGDQGTETIMEVQIMHLPIPLAIAQIDGRIFANLWLHETEDYFEEITENHPWHSLIEGYMNTYFDPRSGRKYTSHPGDELLELYDHDRTPRGIYPRESFYDTDHSQLVVWAFVFDRRGRMLIHRRSDNAKDNQGMWDKSVGGHVEFSDHHTSRAAYREVIEELFTEEPEDVKSDLKKWAISDEEVIYLGDWRPSRRKHYPFQEIRSFEREWAFFRLRDVEGFERLYSPRMLSNATKRRLRVIPDIFLFVAGPQLNEDFLNRLKNSTFKLIELPHLKSVMDRALSGKEVARFDENRFDPSKVNAVPQFSPDLEKVMTGKMRDILEEFSQYIKTYLGQ